MMRNARSLVLIAAGALVGGCAPGIVVQNNASFPVRASISVRGERQVVSPSPGGSSYVEVQEGPYTATVLPDAEWIEYAQATRRFLNEQLANPDNLSGEQLLDVIRRLSDIAVQMAQFERAALSSYYGAPASCAGTVSSESSGTVTITTNEDGRMFIDCD